MMNQGDDDLQYNITWNVLTTKIYKNDTLSNLKQFLCDASSQNTESLSIETDLYLQSGLIYTIMFNLKCIGDHIHSLKYDYNDIECGIVRGIPFY